MRSRKKVSRVDLPEVSRSIPQGTKLELVAAAGGRCELRGCNRFLFRHRVTDAGGYFGNFAHIRAFSAGGPRARVGHEPHVLENLMLLCQDCHTLVDANELDYPVDMLERWKHQHEARVSELLDLPQDHETAVLEVWTNVSHPAVVRNNASLTAALLPLYPSRDRRLIDLSAHNLSQGTLLEAATESIRNGVQDLFRAGNRRPPRIAVFGITTIPLLVFLGAQLGDHQDVRLFQLHRDSSDWRWKDEESRASFSYTRHSVGTDTKRVGILFSLSGKIDQQLLPSSVDATYSVYELALTNETPHRDFLRTEGDLAAFRLVYRRLLSELQQTHGDLGSVVVIPAVPIPIAVAIGMDRLPKVHPKLEVYDLDRNLSPESRYRFKLLA